MSNLDFTVRYMLRDAARDDEMEAKEGQIRFLSDCLNQSKRVLFLPVQAAGGAVTLTQEAMAGMNPTDKLRQHSDDAGNVVLSVDIVLPPVIERPM